MALYLLSHKPEPGQKGLCFHRRGTLDSQKIRTRGDLTDQRPPVWVSPHGPYQVTVPPSAGKSPASSGICSVGFELLCTRRPCDVGLTLDSPEPHFVGAMSSRVLNR